MCKCFRLFLPSATTWNEDMSRYLIAIGNQQSASDCQILNDIGRSLQSAPANWTITLRSPGFCAAHVHNQFSGEETLPLPDDRGVIFGALYRSPKACGTASPVGSPGIRCRSISRDTLEHIVNSKGRSLVTDFWGHYVVAIRYLKIPRAFVMRSPVSALPCFHLQRDTVHVFFSHVEDCVSLELVKFSFNWDSITAQVVGGDYVTSETALKEIRSIECGECVECSPNGCTTTGYWDPRNLQTECALDNFDEAAESVRYTTQYCVNAVSSSHSHVLVNLSGGLDSSVVLSALSSAPHRPELTAINYYSRGCGDERFFATRMANAVDCRLIARLRNDKLDLRCFEDCNPTVQPVLNFSAPDTEGRTIALAREVGASAIVDGELGDNIFGSNLGVGALIECYRKNGMRREFTSAVIDYSMISRQSVWRTLTLAWKELRSLSRYPSFSTLVEMNRRYGEQTARSMILASAEAEEQYANMSDRFVHPWFKSSRMLTPSAHSLLFGLILVTSPTYHSPFSDAGDPPWISPLLSQPLLELILRIPAHLHFKRGQNRALARTAFADRLPDEILNRGTGKGGPNLWVKDVIENNTAYLREILLDGVLVKQRLLDRKKLEAVLSPRIEKSSPVVGDIFAKLYIECWLRNWQTQMS